MNFLLKQIQKPSKDPNDHQALEEAQYAVAHKSWVGHKRHQSSNHSNPCVHQVFSKSLCCLWHSVSNKSTLDFYQRLQWNNVAILPPNQRWNVQATERNGWSQSELTAPMFESLPYPKHQWKLQLKVSKKWDLRKVSPKKFWILHFTNQNSSNIFVLPYGPISLIWNISMTHIGAESLI